MVQIKKYLRGIEHCWDQISLKILCCKYHYISGLKKKKRQFVRKIEVKMFKFFWTFYHALLKRIHHNGILML